VKRRKFLEHLTVTPLVAANLCSLRAEEPQTAASRIITNQVFGARPLAPWAGTEAQAWANVSKAIILTDMSQCQPASALSPRMKKGHWKIIPYELKHGSSGKMIWASPETGAPVMKLSLNVKGWHAIFVGLFCDDLPPSLAWLKLDGDAAPVPRQLSSADEHGNFIADVFFKAAELKGQSLYIGQKSSGYSSACGVAYVKLIPLTIEEVSGYRADLSELANRKLAATCDGFSFIYDRRPTTVEELLAEFEVFRNTDFDTLLLHAIWGGDKVSYPSQYGTIPGLEMDDFAVAGHRYFVEAVRELARKKINPVKVLIDGAHGIGMKVHVGVRPAGWNYGEVLSDFWETPFWRQHPEWQCIDRDGIPTTRMSWAVPEVRKHVIGGLREAVSFGADGAHIVFCRGVPVVLYEPSFLEMFQKRYGEDPRKLDEESDPRIKNSWSMVVTTFMREARVMLDEEQSRRRDGKHLELSAMVFGNEYDNMLYGLDVRSWVAEGVIDEIYTYKWDIGAKKRVDDIKFFLDVCQPKGVSFRPSYTIAPPGYNNTVGEALSWYEQGVKGLVFFDVGGDSVAPGTLVSRLGHVDELRLRNQKESGAAKQPAKLPLHSVGGIVTDGRFPPYMGG
jgi:hypothetical protein